MSSEDNQRGVFPGSELFTTLKKIAKKATQDIQQINRELTTPSPVHDMQDDNLWSQLHVGYNTAHHQSLALQQSLSTQQTIYNSLQSFDSLIKWVKTETNRVEAQLQQFGYTPDTNTNYEYDLPLTPQSQTEFDAKMQKQRMQNDTQLKLAKNIGNEQIQSNTNTNANNDNKAMDIDNDGKERESDTDIDIDNDNHTQETDLNHTIKKRKLNQAQNNNSKPSDSITNSNTNSITPITIIRTTQTVKTIITSPKTPALDDRFKNIYKSYREKSGVSVSHDRNKENEKNFDNRLQKTSVRGTSTVSSISTVTPSMSASVAPSKYGNRLLSPDTPVLSKKFDYNAIRKKCGLSVMSDNKSNISKLNDSLGSLPCLSSPKYTKLPQSTMSYTEREGSAKERRNKPITPYQIQNNQTNITTKPDKQTPITVSSFSLRKNGHKSMDNRRSIDAMGNGERNKSNNNKYGMAYVSESEFKEIPQWITNQIGSVNDINKLIDTVNKALKTWHGRIDKSQFRNLIENETPFILLLTRTNRLTSDWRDGSSVYCLP